MSSMLRGSFVRIVFIVALLAMTSCAEVTHWHSKAIFGLDCRPTHLHNGQCVATR